MFKKIAAASAIAVLAGLTLATPAQADTVNGCAENSVCLFQGINFGQNKWQSSFSNIYNHTSGGASNCMNIAPATWANGTPVNDNSGSLVVNGENIATNVWSHYNIYVFNWINCNSDGGVRAYPGWSETSLQIGTYQTYTNQPSINLYHTITSFQLIPIAAAAGTKKRF